MIDSYLKIDGIPGECKDEKHDGWIQLLSFSHGLSQIGTNLGGGGSRASSGKCEHSYFSFTKYIDKASPKLNLHCCNGANLKRVELEICRQSDRDKICYMKYIFSPCLIANVSIGSEPPVTHVIPDSSDPRKYLSVQTQLDRPVESVSFNYTKIEWTYTELDPQTHASAGDTMAHWDQDSNKGG